MWHGWLTDHSFISYEQIQASEDANHRMPLE
jgi:hypothetical protein